MNAYDVMMYGHRTFLGSLEKLPPDQWETTGVCGVWSAKDVTSHLASYERVLVDVLGGILGEGDMPALKEFMEGGQAFNDRLVEIRKGKRPNEVLDELNRSHADALSLIKRIAPERLRETGTIPWYGPDYSIDDYIAYQIYGHKREHSAQIDAFLDRLGNRHA